MAFAPLIARGYRLVPGHATHRGESIQILSDVVSISVSADWLEGEIEVALQARDGPAISLESLVDVAQAPGLHLRRLPRGLSRGSLESQLSKIATLLIDQASDVLDATPAGPRRLGT